MKSVTQSEQEVYMTLSGKKQYFTAEKDQERVYASFMSAGKTQGVLLCLKFFTTLTCVQFLKA